ncbi:HNH endonuclease [Cupriavidus pinatubonensis]|nr:HNH endonuclease signature motif containing protein [Cupriavidus pinatubonensis]
MTHTFGPFQLDSYHTRQAHVREGDHVYVLSGDRHPDNRMAYALEGVFRVHRRNEGEYYLKNRLGKTESFPFQLSMVRVRVPEQPIPLTTAPWFDEKEFHDYFTSGQNFNPLPSEPDYQARFDALLTEHGTGSELAEDLLELEQTVPNVTDRQVLTMARIGQGKFRVDVTQLWGQGERCALTGLDVPEMLIASHIRPWRQCGNKERLDPTNGLLLASHVDKLFDRHLLSFKPERQGFLLELHPRVATKVAALGLKRGMALRDSRLSPAAARSVAEYLREHYAHFRDAVVQAKPTAS